MTLFLFLLNSCYFQDRKYIQDIWNLTSNFSTSSYFIVINVKCNNRLFPIVIENNTLFDMFYETRLVNNHEEYISKVTDCIISQEPVYFNKKYEEILNSYSVTKEMDLVKLIKKDKKGFIEEFFNNSRLRREKISFLEQKAIIYALFKEKTYCRRDDVSGDFLITKAIKKPSIIDD